MQTGGLRGRRGRGLWGSGQCLRDPRSPAPLDHRQHPGRQLSAKGEHEGGLTEVEDGNHGGRRVNHEGDFSADKWGARHVTIDTVGFWIGVDS